MGAFMNKLVATALCVLATVAGAANAIKLAKTADSDARLKDFADRVVGGQLLVPENSGYEATVFLQLTSPDGTFACGGTYIGSQGTTAVVLTAAHCIPVGATEILAVFLAADIDSFQADANAFFISATEVVVHENYVSNNAGLYNDVAVVTFEDAGTIPVSPATLAAAGSVVAVPGTMQVVGYGSLVFDLDGTNPLNDETKLRLADLRTISIAGCNARNGDIDATEHICAQAPSTTVDRGACQGDSGGPLFLQKAGVNVQVGIVSYGVDCGQFEFPGVYARVSSYISWITAQLPAGMSLQTSLLTSSDSGVAVQTPQPTSVGTLGTPAPSSATAVRGCAAFTAMVTLMTTAASFR